METIHLSNNTQFDARLVVYKDWVESNGKWRLFWADVDDPYCGVEDQSTVTGQPHYCTRRDAVEYGNKQHGITAVNAAFHHN